MKEIYRSFEGKLDADNQEGYIVYEGNGFFEVRNISVWADKTNGSFRVNKPLNWENVEEIAEACFRVENGTLDGQAFYKGKWYKTETINKIQKKYEDGEWRRHIK